MVPGRSYSFVAALEADRTSWTALLDAIPLERVGSGDGFGELLCLTGLSCPLGSDGQVRGAAWSRGRGVRSGQRACRMRSCTFAVCGAPSCSKMASA